MNKSKAMKVELETNYHHRHVYRMSMALSNECIEVADVFISFVTADALFIGHHSNE
jgi:hypothetical protein